MTRTYLAAALAAALAVIAPVAACAQPAGNAPSGSGNSGIAGQPRQNQCFWGHDVENYAPQGDRIVNIRVGVHDVYQMKLIGDCPNLDWNTQRIGLVAQGGSDWICSAIDAEIVARGPLGLQRCPVGEIRKLTPAEAAALPKGARP